MERSQAVTYACPQWGHTLGYLQVSGSKERSIKVGQANPPRWRRLGSYISGLADGVYCEMCVTDPSRFGMPEKLPELTAQEWFGDDVDAVPFPSGRSDIPALVKAMLARDDVASHQHVEAVPYEYVPPGADVDDATRALCAERFSAGLHPHQAEALAASSAGHDVFQAAGTGGGKTLGLLLPAIVAASQGRNTIVCVPRKSVASRIRTEFEQIARDFTDVASNPWLFKVDTAVGQITVGVFDGDTGASLKATEKRRVRKQIREQAQIVVTNLDMVDQHLLNAKGDGWTSWRPFLERTSCVVFDEVDCDEGHDLSQKLWMKRALVEAITSVGDTPPQVLLASATAGAAEEIHRMVTGRVGNLAVVKGMSGRESRDLIVLRDAARNVINDFEAAASRAVDVIVNLTLAADGIPPMMGVFAVTPHQCRQLKDLIVAGFRAAGLGHLATSVAVYTGPTSHADRRDIERAVRMSQGRVTIANEALGVGTDLSTLEVSIHVGCPPSAGKLLQWSGRVGRRSPGLVVVVADDSVLGNLLAMSPAPYESLLSAQSAPLPLVAEHCGEFLLRRLHACIGEIPSAVSASIPRHLLGELCSAGGGFTRVGGRVTPRDPDHPKRTLLRTELRYKLTGPFGERNLSAAIGARHNVIGAEIEVSHKWHRVVRTRRTDRLVYLDVEEIAEPEGWSCSTVLDYSDHEVLATTTSAGLTVTTGVGTVRQQYRSSTGWPPPTTIANAGIATFIAGAKRRKLTSIRSAIETAMFDLGIPSFDVVLDDTDGGFVLFDTNPHGRMSTLIAEHFLNTTSTNRKAA